MRPFTDHLLALKQLFLVNNKPEWMLIALFVGINLLVAINAMLHDPEIGYDANDHLLYVRVLPQKMPIGDDTREFFSPPLPYAIPAILDEGCLFLNPDGEVECRFISGKGGQIINIFLSIGITLSLLKIADSIQPDNKYFKITTLVFIGILPVYYKTFAQFRGEPYVVFFACLSIFYFIRILREPEKPNWSTATKLGLSLGLLALSRQWGFSIFPAIIALTALLLMSQKQSRKYLLNTVSLSFIVAIVISSWFYIHLYLSFGSFTAFNRPTREFALNNKPFTFYRNTGLQNGQLFKTPTRGYFDNMLLPILYSETWGDYWGFFSLPNLIPYVVDNFALTDFDYAHSQQYLGRANLVSIVPSVVLAISLPNALVTILKKNDSIRKNTNRNILLFLMLYILFSAGLYLWFVIIAPTGDGDTIKATYILHIFPALALLTADMFETIRARNTWLFNLLLGICVAIALHNLPIMITTYRLF